MLKFHDTPYEDEPFLFRSPDEIREDLNGMREALFAAKRRLDRLCAVKEELEQLSLPTDVLSSLLPQLKEHVTSMHSEVADLGDECHILAEELKDALFAFSEE